MAMFAATLFELNQSNPGLQKLAQESEEGFVRYPLDNLPLFRSESINIKGMKAGLLPPSEEKVSDLERAKNVCGLAAPGNCRGETQ